MAESRDAAVAAQRAALADTRRRISTTLDAIERRVRPPAARVAHGVAVAREASGTLALISTGIATARQVRGAVREMRAMPRGRLALMAAGVAGVAGVLEWLSHERARPGR
jgi:hypothetical protein